MVVSTENLRSALAEPIESLNDPVGPCRRLSSVLIVEGESDIHGLLKKGLAGCFGRIDVVDDSDAADALLEHARYDLIISDTQLPGRSGVEWVQHLTARDLSAPVIFTATQPDLDTAIQALRAGAADFIPKPFRIEQMQAAVKRCREHQRLRRGRFLLQRQVAYLQERSGIVGSSEPIRDVCEIIKRVAPMPSTVLLHGESGTGKELAALAIHNFSGRRGSFVPINCGAVHAELLESELFGHAKGAFTGAIKAREGLFYHANEGTLFLDEIGEMPLAMQTRLLRVLEHRAVRPVGGNREIPVDTRIVAATNRDLKAEVAAGRFREDLFYRLDVLSIEMPALRERIDDLPQLVDHFANSIAAELGVAAPSIDDAEIRRLKLHDWPGNVRELRNVIERCLLLSRPPSEGLPFNRPPPCESVDATSSEDLSLETVERRHIQQVLEMQGGNKSAAARLLGVSRKTLERKCRIWDVGKA